MNGRCHLSLASHVAYEAAEAQKRDTSRSHSAGPLPSTKSHLLVSSHCVIDPGRKRDMGLPVKAQRLDPEGDRQHSGLGAVGTAKILKCF